MTTRPLLWGARSLLHTPRPTGVLAPFSLTRQLRQLSGTPTDSHATTHRLVDDQDKRAKASEVRPRLLLPATRGLRAAHRETRDDAVSG